MLLPCFKSIWWSIYELLHDKTTCVPSEDSNQPGHLPSLDQSLHCALIGYQRTQGFFMRRAKTLIRLGRCQGWSESSLGAQVILFVLSCGGLYLYSETTVWLILTHINNAVCHSVCIAWMHWCVVKPHCSSFRRSTAVFMGVQSSRIFTVM